MASNTALTTTHLVGFSKHAVPFFYDEQRNGLGSYLFRLQTEGIARALVMGQMIDVLPGDLLLYKPGDPYIIQIDHVGQDGLSANPISVDFFVFCAGEWLDEWWAASPKPSRIRIPLEESLINLWREFAWEAIQFDQLSEQISDYFLKMLCLKIERVLNNLHSAESNKGVFISYRMKTFIEENLSNPFTIEDVAKHVGLSVSRTTHLFKSSFGMSIIQYAHELRLKIAVQRMIYDSVPLNEIASDCGFGSYSYFNRLFRSRFRISPQAYRMQHR